MLNCWCITWPVGFKRLRHLSCRVTSFCMPSSEKVAAKPSNQSWTTYCLSLSLLRLWLAKKFWKWGNWIVRFPGALHSHFLSNHPWPKMGSHILILVMHISPAFFEQPKFPHIPFVYCTLIIRFTTLDFRRAKIFIVWKPHHRRTSQVAVFSVIVYICNYYTELRKHCDMCSSWLSVDDCPSQEVRALPAWPLFTIGSYFFWTRLVLVYWKSAISVTFKTVMPLYPKDRGEYKINITMCCIVWRSELNFQLYNNISKASYSPAHLDIV